MDLLSEYLPLELESRTIVDQNFASVGRWLDNPT